MKNLIIHTELKNWLKAATADEKIELAESCGTSLSYLRLLSGAHRENPKLRLAIAIVQHANRISLRNNRKRKSSPKMPMLTLEGLAIPTRTGYNYEVDGLPPRINVRDRTTSELIGVDHD